MPVSRRRSTTSVRSAIQAAATPSTLTAATPFATPPTVTTPTIHSQQQLLALDLFEHWMISLRKS